MAKLERIQVELAMAQVEFSRSRAEMDYYQVELPKFLEQNEIIQPPNGRMAKLEATMAELERVHHECATCDTPTPGVFFFFIFSTGNLQQAI